MMKMTDVLHQAHATVLIHTEGYTPPSSGAQPPGVGKIDTIIQWVMWGASVVLFALFIVGLVKAGSARRAGGDADVSAPIWPLVAAVIVGASAAIWQIIAG